MDRLPLGKTCTKCKDWKLFVEFFRDRSKLDGLTTICKVCKRALNKAWDKSNSEKLRIDKHAYYQANRERILAKRKVEYERMLIEDEPRLRARQREERKRRSSVKQRKAKKRWRDAKRQTNPEVLRHYARQHHARKRAQTTNGGIALEAWYEICASFGFCCIACGTKTALEMDHVVPLSMGGEHQIENVQPLCRSCNASKGAKTIDYR